MHISHSLSALIFFGLLCGSAVAVPADELRRQFNTLQSDIKNRARMVAYGDEVYRREAIILPEDHDPLDVVLRRTQALLKDLSGMPGTDLAEQSKALAELQSAANSTALAAAEARYRLYVASCALRRKIAVANPLLDFDKLLFLKRHRAGYNHMCDQYYGINAKPGGGICVLRNPFSDEPEVADILAEAVVKSYYRLPSKDGTTYACRRP
jgi:hypothetical protein